ncbi:3-dehydroquinate dehydratase [Halolactibacillus halophilus]|uniref:3-dehydroquinate dehydratase n=1 Tax=Halolactibacillus halophilus TaxID=306540 RepID=A0A1I5PRV9_9BACI|nr:type I 3-dehydroquinate dehydratase [Halolactibacillus halophilus]GEM01599.1 3-dehydroquinate dehydratase [Halolactibacillus halophilus]SFP36842.1 3-dehydroquinate dehydratase [Halolactibacillus halophilus]
MKIKNVSFDTKSRPNVCVAIVATTEAMFNQRWQETRRADIDVIEWRADYYTGDGATPLSWLKAESRPVIYTIRTKEEGGEWPYQKDQYMARYKQAIDSGAVDVIDLEWARDGEAKTILKSYAKEHGVKVITSYHDFNATPDFKAGMKLLQALSEDGGDIVKLAVMPESKQDVLTLLSLTLEVKKVISQPVITMSMGQEGVISRLLGEWSGSVLTFGSVSQASAPGQVTVTDLTHTLKDLHRYF